MNMRSTTLLLTTLLVSLLPASAMAGHFQADIDPCEWLGAPIPACRKGESTGDCWTYGREGEYANPTLCPDPRASSSCLALGLFVREASGLVTSQNSRSAADLYGWPGGRAAADANQQRVDTPLASEGTLLTECQTQTCDSSAEATAARVSLLGGLIEASALEAGVSATCWDGPQSHVKVTSLIIDGHDYGDFVHPSRIVVPGVGVVTIGQTDYFTTPYGGYGVSTTALRVDLVDALGVYRGTIRVSHALAAVS